MRGLSTSTAGTLVADKAKRDRQVRPQRLQLKVTPGTVVVEVSRFFLLRRFFLRLFLRESSKEETAWWIMWRQVTRSASRVDRCDGQCGRHQGTSSGSSCIASLVPLCYGGQ